MRNFGKAWLAAAVIAAGLTGLGNPAFAEEAAGAKGPEQVVAAGNVAFGVDLYRKLATAEKGNVFFSPISIAGAFGPLVAGAEGKTREEMLRTLHFVPDESLHPSLGSLLKRLEQPREGATVAIANALWPDRTLVLKPEFLATALRHYESAIEPLDFDDKEGSAKRVNAWASEQTNGRIKDVVTPLSFGSKGLIVANAVYMLADWQQAFSEEDTEPQPFQLADGGRPDVPLMHQQSYFRYLETSGVQAVDLPYKDGRLSMSIFLPKGDLARFDRQLTGNRLVQWLSALDGVRPREVKLFLPRLEISDGYELKAPLESLGMARAFTADSEIRAADNGPLKIAKVLQKIFLRIDERGTEAAAVTIIDEVVITGLRNKPPVPVFRADRPFFVVIRDRPSGAILFMGRIDDPRR